VTELALPHEWDPRPYQRKAWHYLQNGGLRLALVWHRRAGKDEVAMRWTSRASQERVGNYWHMLPQKDQARKAIWEAVNPHTGKNRVDEAFPDAMRAKTLNNEMFIKFKNGSTWQVVGSDNFDSLIGSPPIGLVFSEYAVADPRAWTMLRPILAENGGWAIFPYTPRGKNHGWALRETARLEDHWMLDEKTVDQTNVFTKKLLESELRELIREEGQEAGEAYFRQEYYVSFDAATRGAYYVRLMQQAEEDERICGVPYDGAGLVMTAWDIGIGDSTAIWFIQAIGRELRAIDYYEASGMPIAHYVEVLNRKGYAYGDDIMPHDAGSRELGTGKSIKELMEGMGRKVRLAPKLSVDQGIQATRVILPRMYFDAKKCERGVAALRQYRAEYDEELKVLSNRPLHDWTSHGCDAMRMFAVAYRDVIKTREAPAVAQRWIV
jgi:phage terminase large subunit